MFKKDNFFKNYFIHSSKYYNNIKKTKKVFKSFLVDLKNFKIPLLESYDKEYEFDFGDRTQFKDMETGETITTDPWHIRSDYQSMIDLFQKKYRTGCRNQRIDYVPLFTNQSLDLALNEYLKKRQKSG